MSVQGFVMSKPSLTRAFMSTMPSSFHEKGGFKLRDHTLQLALSETQAYPVYLSEHGIDPTRASALAASDWTSLPMMDKSSYIESNEYTDLVCGGRFDTAYTIEKSSGHGGRTYYWFRTPAEDALFPSYLEYAFRQFYGLDKHSTLVIMGLALGTWTSGEKMAQALRQVAARGRYPLTVMSPGNKAREILEIVADISPHYDQTVLVGYPPFVKHVIDMGVMRGYDWPSLCLKIGLGGEGYSEPWREYVADRIGVDSSRDLLAISGGYGAADLGMSVGREYPLTVLIKKLCETDRELSHALLGDGAPMLFQYSPAGAFIESVGEELIFTVPSGIPLVRYNIHDRGGLLGYEQVLGTLSEFGYDPILMLKELGYTRGDIWRLPFFYCHGRSDGTVILAGVNIHPDFISSALTFSGDADVTGHKIGLHVDEGSYDGQLLILLEHRDEALAEDLILPLAKHYRRIIVEGLRRVSSEYENLYQSMGDRATPIVRVYRHGSGPFAEDEGKIKRRYTL